MAQEEASTAPPGTHPVLLLCLKLPHTLQEPCLGPVQVGSEACDGDDIGLQLRCWDVYIHLVEMEQTQCTWSPPMASLEVVTNLPITVGQGHPRKLGTRRLGPVKLENTEQEGPPLERV